MDASVEKLNGKPCLAARVQRAQHLLGVGLVADEVVVDNEDAASPAEVV
jgi:hypothetical protein